MMRAVRLRAKYETFFMEALTAVLVCECYLHRLAFPPSSPPPCPKPPGIPPFPPPPPRCLHPNSIVSRVFQVQLTLPESRPLLRTSTYILPVSPTPITSSIPSSTSRQRTLTKVVQHVHKRL